MGTVDLHKWKTVMGAYRDGGHMYHATMPTDAIKIFRDVVHETEKFGLKEAEKATWDLGMGVRKVLKDKGYTSVAAEAGRRLGSRSFTRTTTPRMPVTLRTRSSRSRPA